MQDVWIVIGSESDVKRIKGLPEFLEEKGISFRISVFSAHRNLYELIEFMKRLKMMPEKYPKVIIAAAGMSATLPGIIASILKKEKMPIPVIGVPLPSDYYPNAHDARISIGRLPPGTREFVELAHSIDDAKFKAQIIMTVNHPKTVAGIARKFGESKEKEPIPNLPYSGGE